MRSHCKSYHHFMIFSSFCLWLGQQRGRLSQGQAIITITITIMVIMNTMITKLTITTRPPASVPSHLSPLWPLGRVTTSAARLASAALTGQGYRHCVTLWHVGHGQVEPVCGPGGPQPPLLLWQVLHILQGLLWGLQAVLSQASGKRRGYMHCEITRQDILPSVNSIFSGFRLGRKFYLYYHESKYNFARLSGPLSICWPEVHKYERAWGENSYEWLPLAGY